MLKYLLNRLADRRKRKRILYERLTEPLHPNLLSIFVALFGFVAVDVDYYWSAKECLNILKGEPSKYLPITLIHLDDIGIPSSNPWVGELLAVNEFNAEHTYRKIHPYTFLRNKRIFKHTRWIDHIFVMHTLDHPRRNVKNEKSIQSQVLSNPYL
jgi:hypothetical protein